MRPGDGRRDAVGGLRRYEVLGLRFEDITAGEQRGFIVEGKGGHQRIVPISTRFFTALAAYLADTPPFVPIKTLLVRLPITRRGPQACHRSLQHDALTSWRIQRHRPSHNHRQITAVSFSRAWTSDWAAPRRRFGQAESTPRSRHRSTLPISTIDMNSHHGSISYGEDSSAPGNPQLPGLSISRRSQHQGCNRLNGQQSFSGAVSLPSRQSQINMSTPGSGSEPDLSKM